MSGPWTVRLRVPCPEPRCGGEVAVERVAAEAEPWVARLSGLPCTGSCGRTWTLEVVRQAETADRPGHPDIVSRSMGANA